MGVEWIESKKSPMGKATIVKLLKLLDRVQRQREEYTMFFTEMMECIYYWYDG
jgi:hypothetical protein